MPKKRSVKPFYLPRTSTRLAAPVRAAGQAAPELPNTRKIATAAIDWSYTLRPINIDHIERLGGAAALPPIAAWEVERGRYRGIDGYHRWRLAKHRHEPSVDVIVHHFPSGPAGEQAFEFEAVRSNLQHGLPLSREERNRAIARLWSRWGRTDARPDGHTLEEIGQLFNLTKQRVHQIVTAQPLVGVPPLESEMRRAAHAFPHRAPSRASDQPRAVAPGVQTAVSRRIGTPGRFSTFGRFSAATRRLTNLLRDGAFLTALLRQHRADAIEQLDEIRDLIEETLATTR